jgi:GPH family glycoside/pentoside/hexuronide:cation symporter
VVEDSQTSTGRRSEGLFFAGPNLIQKAISGVGLMAKGPLLYFVGFQAAASTADKTLAIQDLALVVAVLSVIMPAICLYLLSKYQITREQHQGNLSGLGYRDEVDVAQPPISTK